MAKRTLPSDWKSSCFQFMVPLMPGRLSNYSTYNGNYYPEHVSTLLHRAVDIHGLVLYFGLNYSKQLLFDKQEFQAQLSRRMKLESFPRFFPSDDGNQLAVCQLGTSTAAFFSFVISVKALLDVMATVWIKIADSTAPTMTFNRSRVGGQELAGGKLINWFKQSCPAMFDNRSEAAEVLEQHSRKWITELVQYRDNFNHHGGIPDLTPLCVMLVPDDELIGGYQTYSRTEYSLDEMIEPALPTGELITDFVALAGNYVQEMMIEMARLFASDQPRSSPGMPQPGDRWYIADELLDKEAEPSTDMNRGGESCGS